MKSLLEALESSLIGCTFGSNTIRNPNISSDGRVSVIYNSATYDKQYTEWCNKTDTSPLEYFKGLYVHSPLIIGLTYSEVASVSFDENIPGTVSISYVETDGSVQALSDTLAAPCSHFLNPKDPEDLRLLAKHIPGFSVKKLEEDDRPITNVHQVIHNAMLSSWISDSEFITNVEYRDGAKNAPNVLDVYFEDETDDTVEEIAYSFQEVKDSIIKCPRNEEYINFDALIKYCVLLNGKYERIVSYRTVDDVIFLSCATDEGILTLQTDILDETTLLLDPNNKGDLEVMNKAEENILKVEASTSGTEFKPSQADLPVEPSTHAIERSILQDVGEEGVLLYRLMDDLLKKTKEARVSWKVDDEESDDDGESVDGEESKFFKDFFVLFPKSNTILEVGREEEDSLTVSIAKVSLLDTDGGVNHEYDICCHSVKDPDKRVTPISFGDDIFYKKIDELSQAVNLYFHGSNKIINSMFEDIDNLVDD